MSTSTSVKKIDRETTVKQSNRLVVARYTLTLMEQRLMYAVCSQIAKNASDFEKVKFSVSELAELCGICGDRKYDDIKKVSQKLMKRLVTVPTADGGEYETHWLQSRRYYPVESAIEFKLDSDLKKELLQLKRAYVDTPVSMLIGFKKKYASRMYLILKKMIKVKDFEYELDFFRKTFQLADTYKKFSNIKNGVLEPALKEINETSDLDVVHEYVKEGRFYTKIHFIIKLKKASKETENKSLTEGNKKPINPPQAKDCKDRLTDDKKEIFAKITNPDKWNLSSDMALDLIQTFGVDRVKKNLVYCDKHRKGKHNLAGFLIKMIKDDAAADEERRVADKRHEEEKQKARNKGVVLKEILKQNKESKGEEKRGLTEENRQIGKKMIGKLKDMLADKSSSVSADKKPSLKELEEQGQTRLFEEE